MIRLSHEKEQFWYGIQFFKQLRNRYDRKPIFTDRDR
jgi:hypothetical protein